MKNYKLLTNTQIRMELFLCLHAWGWRLECRVWYVLDLSINLNNIAGKVFATRIRYKYQGTGGQPISKCIKTRQDVYPPIHPKIIRLYIRPLIQNFTQSSEICVSRFYMTNFTIPLKVLRCIHIHVTCIIF